MTTGPGTAQTDGRRISCLVADDHAIVREGLRRVLSQPSDMLVVGEAPSGEAALELVAKRRPEVVLMDARMPGMGGVAAAGRIAQEHPDVRVVMFTAHSEQDLLWEALDAGAQGFVLKDSESGVVVSAIRQVVAGDPYIDERLRLIPGHCDPTVNLHDWYVGVRGGVVECLWPVTARGRVW